MNKIYQQPLINIIKINAEDLLKKVVVASKPDEAAGAKKVNFDYSEDEDWEQNRWYDGEKQTCAWCLTEGKPTYIRQVGGKR